jgi:2-hydroxychromene-2-carboxylate isomerase
MFSRDYQISDAERYIESHGLPIRKLTGQAQIDANWEMAHALDLAGDKYKAEGKLESANACYKRAFYRATLAHNAGK